MIMTKQKDSKPKKSYNVGNLYAQKYKTPEARKGLCTRYCEHLKNGFTKDCFPECDYLTVYDYIEKYPEDFDIVEIRIAERTQLLRWEQRLAKNADEGGGNATCSIFGVKNIARAINKTLWVDSIDHNFVDGEAKPIPVTFAIETVSARKPDADSE